MLLSYFLFALILVQGCYSQEKPKCGYEACDPTIPGRLNVHLVPHSHDDVGWLKTVDQYYSGSYRNVWSSDNEVQKAGVQYTLDTVIRELAFDPKKKYIQVETAFFWRWWSEQNDQMKDLVIDLVYHGQIEFVGGGWCMNDEAAAHYVSIIDQMSLGFKKLKDIFGECGIPLTAWQIDPFGHSREQADLFNEMGFDALFFGRLDYREKSQRLKNQTAEMLWETSDEPKEDKHLLTGVLFNNYSPPDGFCWDLLCNDAPLMDNPALEDYNMDERAQAFIDYARNQHQYYTSSNNASNILITMGMDFHYQAAHSWYKNLDKLINYINSHFGEKEAIHLLYSTPSCYVQARGSDLENVPVKKDDFFPYASDPHAYWTGYFSSRPTSKYFIRETSRWLQFGRVISSKVLLTNETQAAGLAHPLEQVAQAVGITQHHDAITGTEKQHVADDYHRILHNAIHSFAKAADFTICPLLNISQCEVTESADEVTFAVYNPLAHKRSGIIHIPVATNLWSIEDQSGASLAYQVVELPAEVQNIPGRTSKAIYDLGIQVDGVPALGFNIIRMKKVTDSKRKGRVHRKIRLQLGEAFEFKTRNGYHKVKFNPTGFSHTMPNQESLNFGFGMYYAHPGNNSQFEFRASGAYIFRPLEQKPVDLLMNDLVVNYGPLYIELHVTFQFNASAVYRIAKDGNMNNGELEWLVGPISIDDGFGKEFVVKWSTLEPFNQDTYFYTDSNGRQLLKRTRNARESYDPENAFLEEPVSANYYPINSGILIIDEYKNSLLSVVTDRAQGASSLKDSEIEIMVHRRLLDDDAFGVAEPLNEVAFGQGLVARGRQIVRLETDIIEGYANYRFGSNALFGDFLPIFNVDKKDLLGDIITKSGSHVRKFELPANINLLTLDPVINDTLGVFTKEIVLRLEHIFATGEHPEYSKPVILDLVEIFGSEGLAIGNISEMRETALGANQDKKVTQESDEVADPVDPRQVEMNPMQIRTFIVKFSEV